MLHAESAPSEYQINRRGLLTGAALGTAALLLDACSNPHEQKEPQYATEPDWEQDFTAMPDGPLDPAVWNIASGNGQHGWGNEQKQFYTVNAQNVRVQGGRLVLQANHLDRPDRPYISGRIDTRGNHSFGYGKLEVMGRVPLGAGTWSAFWMLPETPKYQAEAFGLNTSTPGAGLLNGEIDIMEALGSRPGRIYPNLHTFNTASSNVSLDPLPQTTSPDDTAKFHAFGVERTPDSVTFTYDHKPYYRVGRDQLIPKGQEDKAPLYWPFDQDYYLILNLAMGGDWASELADQYPPDGIDNSTGPWQLRVTSVKHYPLLP